MKKNNDLKERLKIELDTPEVPFDEWAQKRRVFEELGESSAVAYPVTELADNVSGRGISGGNKTKIIIISSVIAFIVAVAIILGVFLPRVNNIDLPEIFGANDASTVETNFEEVAALNDVYLFDMSNVFEMQLVNKDILNEDNSQVLLYSITNCILSVENGGGADAFCLTYQIRTYANYEFYNFENYSKLERSITVNNFKVNYKIIEHNDLYGYAMFKDGNYEYFIAARGFNNITVLSEDNFINLLNKILI